MRTARRGSLTLLLALSACAHARAPEPDAREPAEPRAAIEGHWLLGASPPPSALTVEACDLKRDRGIPDVQLTLRCDALDHPREALTDRDGRAYFHGLPAGDCAVDARGPHGARTLTVRLTRGGTAHTGYTVGLGSPGRAPPPLLSRMMSRGGWMCAARPSDMSQSTASSALGSSTRTTPLDPSTSTR